MQCLVLHTLLDTQTRIPRHHDTSVLQYCGSTITRYHDTTTVFYHTYQSSYDSANACIVQSTIAIQLARVRQYSSFPSQKLAASIVRRTTQSRTVQVINRILQYMSAFYGNSKCIVQCGECNAAVRQGNTGQFRAILLTHLSTINAHFAIL